MADSILGRSIRLFLVDGTPTGLITAEIINWTGHALSSPYSRLRDLWERPEAQRSGVYFLIGDDEEDDLRQRIYIGESENIKERLYQHERGESKDFTEQICIITSKDPNLTKGHLRYLEARLIRMASDAARVRLDNSSRPSPPPLPEADIADMEYFLSQIAVILPVLNFHFLRPTRPVVVQHGSLPASIDVGIKLILKPERLGRLLASAIYKDTDFVVLAGSQTRPDSPGSVYSYKRQRLGLIESGRLSALPSGQGFVFTEDTPFRSPSAAAAVILDRNANGRYEWQTEDSEMTLKAYQESQIKQGVEIDEV
jgi:hypothetical protein